MRKRMVSPEIWMDEKVAKLSLGGRLLFIGLITISNDFGKSRGNLVFIKSTIFPYDEHYTVQKIKEDLTEIVRLGMIIQYQSNEETFIKIKNWSNYQTLMHPSKDTIPDPTSKQLLDEIKTVSRGLQPQDKVREVKLREVKTPTPVSECSETETETETETTKEYVIKTDDLSQVIYSYKQVQGYTVDDRNWDKQNWRRVTRSAQLLLAGMGTRELAELCIQELGAEFKAKGLSWTLQGAILNNSSAWLIAYKKRDNGMTAIKHQQMENLCIKCHLSPKVADGLCAECWDKENPKI